MNLHATTQTDSLVACVIGRMAMFCVCLGLLATTGCITTVSMDEKPRVTESLAKRDLGIDYLTTGRTAMAIRELMASVKLDPKDPATHLWLGEAYRRKGKNGLAEEYLKEAVELSSKPEYIRSLHAAQLNLSALLGQIGRYEESIEYCKSMVVDPTVSTPWRPLTNCGWAQMKLNRLDEARVSFEDALDYFPGYGPALLNLGILEAKEGHQLAAIKTFERALDRLSTGGRAEVNYRLGELYVAMGHRNLAVGYFSEAVLIAPQLDWGSQSQAYLDLLR